MTRFRVLRPGVYSSIQDLGRHGYQRHGLSVSGAADKYSLRVGNLLLGNDLAAAAIETTLFGLELEVQSRSTIAVTGGDLGFAVNGKPAPTWTTLAVAPGDVLRFTGGPIGCRAYVCVKGGIDVPVQFGSRATDSLVGLGGVSGRELKAGDEIGGFDPWAGTPEAPAGFAGARHAANAFVSPPEIRGSGPSRSPSSSLGRRTQRRVLSPRWLQNRGEAQVIRVVFGPQEEAFSAEGIRTFLNSSYSVTPQSNHIGCHLEGPEIAHKHKADILSECIPEGAIQVPASGKPIVLLAGRRGVGGYAKIANVISVDIPKIAQARPGDQVVFQSISVQAAQALLVRQERYFRLMDRLVQHS